MAKATFTRRPVGAQATPAPAAPAAAAAPARPTRRVAAPAPAEPEPEPQEQVQEPEPQAAAPAPARPTRRVAAPAAAAPAPAPTRRQAAPPPEPEPQEPEQTGDDPTTELANVESSLTVPTEMVQGQIDRSDISTPGLKIVQAVGPLSEMFDPGCIVLTQGGENSLPITSPGQEQPLVLTVLRIRKQFIEDLPYGSEERPRIFDTIEDVQAAGGWIEWHNNERPPFAKMATAMVVVAAPEDASAEELAHFPYEFDGGKYALALWTIKGTAYQAAKAIFTASVYSLTPAKGGLVTGAWHLTTKREKRGQNMVWVPVLKQAGVWDAEFVEFLNTLAG